MIRGAWTSLWNTVAAGCCASVCPSSLHSHPLSLLPPPIFSIVSIAAELCAVKRDRMMPCCSSLFSSLAQTCTAVYQPCAVGKAASLGAGQRHQVQGSSVRRQPPGPLPPLGTQPHSEAALWTERSSAAHAPAPCAQPVPSASRGCCVQTAAAGEQRPPLAAAQGLLLVHPPAGRSSAAALAAAGRMRTLRAPAANCRGRGVKKRGHRLR